MILFSLHADLDVVVSVVARRCGEGRGAGAVKILEVQRSRGGWEGLLGLMGRCRFAAMSCLSVAMVMALGMRSHCVGE